MPIFDPNENAATVTVASKGIGNAFAQIFAERAPHRIFEAPQIVDGGAKI